MCLRVCISDWEINTVASLENVNICHCVCLCVWVYTWVFVCVYIILCVCAEVCVQSHISVETQQVRWYWLELLFPTSRKWERIQKMLGPIYTTTPRMHCFWHPCRTRPAKTYTVIELWTFNRCSTQMCTYTHRITAFFTLFTKWPKGTQ